MKEYLSQLVQDARNPLQGRHQTREYLQARILASLQRAGALVPLAFHGGTALRFLYRIPRYSEDLDFALERAEDLYDFRAYLKVVRAAFSAEGFEMLRLQHHDRASLLSGKLHAILQRSYSKGRDFYDLFWYLSSPDWPSPNLTLLNNALMQTGWSGERITESNWRAVVLRHLDDVNWDALVTDVRPFLMDPQDIDLLTKTNFVRLLND